MSRRMMAYASPDEWFDDAQDWQKPLIASIREAITVAADFEEIIKYGNLFFLHGGPAILIRHESERILLGLFRGKRLREIEPLLKASGKYELANLILSEGDDVSPDIIRQLAQEAARLNDELGDPTDRR